MFPADRRDYGYLGLGEEDTLFFQELNYKTLGLISHLEQQVYEIYPKKGGLDPLKNLPNYSCRPHHVKPLLFY
jgi:hypothetical protein